VDDSLAIGCIRPESVWQLAREKGKHGVCVSDRAGHRRPISAIGDVQFGCDELMDQNQTGIPFMGVLNILSNSVLV